MRDRDREYYEHDQLIASLRIGLVVMAVIIVLVMLTFTVT